MLNSILEVFKDDFIDIACRRTGNVLFGGNSEQRNIAKHTDKVEIKDAAKSMRFTHHASLRFGVACPVDVFLLNDELVATEYGFIIVLPVHVEDIVV